MVHRNPRSRYGYNSLAAQLGMDPETLEPIPNNMWYGIEGSAGRKPLSDGDSSALTDYKLRCLERVHDNDTSD